jgi:hypothetical protein
MKKVLIFLETQPYCERRIRGVFTSPQLAYDYMNDYLNYLRFDANEFLGGDELVRELSRLNLIQKKLPEILKWDLEGKNFIYFFAEGLELIETECFEQEEDLPKNQSQKKNNCVLEF